MAPLKTPLHFWHMEHGARMAGFGGYEMPLWYGSAKEEHLTVLTRAGLFDTSHMAVIMVDGTGALDLLQFCFTNDLSACLGPRKAPLKPGRSVYGAFLTEAGHVLDDAIVFMLGEASFMVVVNAGMGPVVARHLADHRSGRPVQVKDLSGQVGKMDIQGPLAAIIMQDVLRDAEKIFEGMPYFAFKGGFGAWPPTAGKVATYNNLPLLLSRTGYTGEFGFEIFATVDAIFSIWKAVVAAGRRYGAIPCGLAARDSLRAGAVLPLSHQDIGAWPFCHNPWPFALPYVPGKRQFSKSFLGAAALEPCRAPFTYPFVGDDLRKVSPPAEVRDQNGRALGQVLTCVTDMAIGWHDNRVLSIASPDRPRGFRAGGLSCGFVKVGEALPWNTQLMLKDKRRQIAVRVMKDVRPDRTARQPIPTMLQPKEE